MRERITLRWQTLMDPLPGDSNNNNNITTTKMNTEHSRPGAVCNIILRNRLAERPKEGGQQSHYMRNLLKFAADLSI